MKLLALDGLEFLQHGVARETLQPGRAFIGATGNAEAPGNIRFEGFRNTGRCADRRVHNAHDSAFCEAKND